MIPRNFLCCLLACLHGILPGQSPPPAAPVIEGGKLIVELVKVFSSKKEVEKDPGCKGHYANICVYNESTESVTVLFEHRTTDEQREVVIQPTGKECCLQARTGVWTYDLRWTGTSMSMRKGDLLIEGCNNIDMRIK